MGKQVVLPAMKAKDTANVQYQWELVDGQVLSMYKGGHSEQDIHTEQRNKDQKKDK